MLFTILPFVLGFWLLFRGFMAVGVASEMMGVGIKGAGWKMCIRDSSEELRRALGSRDRSGIGFVPTMGALHAGHRSRVERARRECATVVVSVFVNPTQFNDKTDLKT